MSYFSPFLSMSSPILPEPFAQRASSALSVNISAVADGDHENDKAIVLNLVDDSVVTKTDSEKIFRSNQLLAPTGPRIEAEVLDLRRDATLNHSRKLCDRASRRRLVMDLVRQSDQRPR